jgi:hypothetical protein
MAQFIKCHAGGIDWSWLPEMIHQFLWFFIDFCVLTNLEIIFGSISIIASILHAAFYICQKT